MDDKNELEKIKEKYQARNKYINDYMKNNYDRIVLLLPKGYKDTLTTIAKNNGYKSTTEYIKTLIDQDASTAAATLPGAKEPEPEPVKNPYEGMNWADDSLPFG